MPCLLPALIKGLAVSVGLDSRIAAVQQTRLAGKRFKQCLSSKMWRAGFNTKSIILAGAIAGALAAFFVLSVYFLPQSYLGSIHPTMPGPIVTDVRLSQTQIALGESFSLQVSATNSGEHADMQILSIAFPSLSSTDGIVDVQKHDFRQTPLFIKKDTAIGAGYTAQRLVPAQYPSIEASNRPWNSGETFSIELSIKPQTEGEFIIFVKAVGLPHNGDQAHWPSNGTIDHQDEFVSVYSVNVTKA